VREFVRRDLRVAVVPWVLSRIIVVAALATARFLHTDTSSLPRPIPLAQGLFAWDAGWYRALAEFGYTGNHESALRFFPLLPALSRGLGFVFLGHEDVALIVIANLGALVLAALLHRLALVDTGDEAVAVRAAWFVLLLSPAVALVLGYAESLAMSLSVGAFLCIRSRRWALAGVLALLAGLARPVGILLVLPLLVEAWSTWSGTTVRERVERVLAVVAPAVGMAIYLVYVGIRFGDPFEPLSVQNTATLRGGFVDPFSRIVRAIEATIDGGDRFGSGLHLFWAAVFGALLIVVWRTLPRSYFAYCALALVLGLSASNLDSFERYCLSTFPFVLAVAVATRRSDVERTVFVLSSAGLFGYALLAFFGSWVP
jgi:hypothetical protein